jgi:hypothetical protein
MKKLKNIGITDDVKKRLLLQAIDKGISFKLHCENVLEEASKGNVEKKKRRGTVPIQSKPMDIVRQTAEIAKQVEKMPPIKEAKGSLRVDKGSKKYDKIGTNLFYNGENYMARKYVDKKFVEEFFETEDEARTYLND